MRGSLWLAGRKDSCLEPGEWPARIGTARVLIEQPDPATAWAEAESMRDAGYDVAVCLGPSRPFERSSAHTTCPLVVDGHCALAEEADVVVSTTDLGDSCRVLAALGQSAPALVVESTRPVLERGDFELGGATILEAPVTEGTLRTAVGSALPH